MSSTDAQERDACGCPIFRNGSQKRTLHVIPCREGERDRGDVLGLPIRADPNVERNTVELRDSETGRLLGKITDFSDDA